MSKIIEVKKEAFKAGYRYYRFRIAKSKAPYDEVAEAAMKEGLNKYLNPPKYDSVI